MKKQKLFVKLFIVTSILLLILLAAQFVFQTFYFEKFYIFTKEQALIKDMRMLKDKVENLPEGQVETEFFKYAREKGVTAGVVNLYGRPIYGFDAETQYPFVDISDQYGQAYRVYLNHFMESGEFVDRLEQAEDIRVWGQIIKSKYYEIYPMYIQLDGVIYTREKKDSMGQIGKLFKDKLSILKSVEIHGKINYIYTPQSEYGIEYREARLLNEIINILDSDISIYDMFENETQRIFEKVDNITGVNNMIGLLPITVSEMPMLLVTMASLQSVEEAAGVMNQYFIIMFIMIFMISLIAVYIYAKWVTKPLVHLNDVTQKLSQLDFSDECIVKRNDEIGSLADNINQMSDRLQITLEQLKEDLELRNKLDEERKRFIADVSHELKTPLTVIKGTCEGLVDGVYDNKQKEYYVTMLEEINDMGQMIQDLLEISQVENEEILKITVFDLSEILYKVHSHLKPLAKEKDLKIKFDVEEAFVQADEKRIETVIRNLYNNAIFYTPKGGEINIGIQMRENKIRLNIENLCVSIEEHELEKIWDAFYRVDQSRNKELGGSGLGLYIVKQILEKHGSTFGIENSESGVNAWFEIRGYTGELE